jgi:hypothetical protein
MPRTHAPLLQHHLAARPEESDVVGDLVWSTTQRSDLEPSRRLQLAREEVVLREHDVAEGLRVHEPSGGREPQPAFTAAQAGKTFWPD